MKVVTIKEIQEPVPGTWIDAQTYYQVRLGNGKVCQFTQRRDADAFVVATSKYLTEVLIDVNELYISIFAEYRRMWFYFDGRTKESLEKMQNIERELRSHLDQVQYTFDNIHRNRITGGNVLPFTLIAKAIGAIYKATLQIIELRRKRSEYVERVRLENLKKKCFYLVKDLGMFGSNVEFTQMPDNIVTTVLNSM